MHQTPWPGGGKKFSSTLGAGRGGGRALLNVRNFSWAILLRKIEVFTIPGPALLPVVSKGLGTWPGCSHRHRAPLLLTIFERGLRGLGLYQWVSTVAFKKIEKAAAFFEKAAGKRCLTRARGGIAPQITLLPVCHCRPWQ